jgi:hypothetical protein
MTIVTPEKAENFQVGRQQSAVMNGAWDDGFEQ